MAEYNIPLSSAQGAASNLDTRAPLNPAGTELPLQLKKFENIDPIQQMAKAYSLADNIGQFQENQAQRMDQQMIRETKQRDQAILKAYQQDGGGLHSADDLSTALQRLGTKLSPDTVENLQKRRDAAQDYEVKAADNFSKMTKDGLSVIDQQYEAGLKQMSALRQVYDNALAKNGGNQEQALQAYEAARQAQLKNMATLVIPGTQIRQFPDQVLQQYAGMNPDQLKSAIEGSKYNRDLVAQAMKQKLEESQIEANKALAGKRIEETAELPEKLKLAQQKLETELRKAGGKQLSPEGLAAALAMYRAGDKSVASRMSETQKKQFWDGLGTEGAAEGKSATDVAVDTTTQGANLQELNTQQKKLGAIQSIMGSFHNNIQTWDSLAQGKPPAIGGDRLKALGEDLKTIDFTPSTALNDIKNKIEKQFNDPSTVAYVTSAFTVAMDYARILSSQGQSAAQVSDSAREEALKIISAGYDDKARQALIGTLESDAQGQVKGIQDTVDRIKEQIKKQAGGASRNDPAMQIAPADQATRDHEAGKMRVQEVGSVDRAKQELEELKRGLAQAKTPVPSRSFKKIYACYRLASTTLPAQARSLLPKHLPAVP